MRVADPATARKRIGDLELKVGQQQVELEIFSASLAASLGARHPNDGPGAPASTRSSR